MATKTQQLQIRLTWAEKARLKRLARHAGMDVSSYVLSCVLPPGATRMRAIVEALEDEADHRPPLAELNDFLTSLSPAEFGPSLADVDPSGLSPLLRNYVAAMVEEAAYRKEQDPPGWTRDVPPLESPYFAVDFRRLHPHLLRASPVAFKRRNLFVDATLGDRV